MNLYFYWYFTFYRFYERFSKDKYFDIFASGLFSLFSSCLFIGILGITQYILGIPINFINTAEKSGLFFGIIIIINYLIFIPKQRQQRLYTKYKESQSTKKDIFSILLTILSILLVILAVKGNQYLNK